MRVSFNEIDTTTKKAFRGAGYYWGEAEEAGKAAVWLARHGLFGGSQVLSLLQYADQHGAASLRPLVSDRQWRATGSKLCPICTGIALVDVSGRLNPGDRLDMSNLLSPVLLLPFAIAGSAAVGLPVMISWTDCRVIADKTRILSDNLAGLASASGDVKLHVMPSEPVPAWPALEQIQTVEVDSASWTELHRFAHRTYVPASEQSRSAGAGAGLSDND